MIDLKRSSVLFVAQTAVAAFVVLGVVSCEQGAVRGKVLDVMGSPLPGVIVSANDGESQTVTSPLGVFNLYEKPGMTTLRFMKTGFAPAVARVAGKALAAPVKLWCLPDDAGVFFFENFRYRKLGQAEPRPYELADKKLVYGLSKQEGVAQVTGPFRLILYKVPSYDARIDALVLVQATLVGGTPSPQSTLVASGDIPVQLVPVDEPEHLLWEVQPLDPLPPGMYALHWGALEGHTSTDSRLFVFEVTAPPAPAEGASPEPAAPAGSSK